MGTGPTEGSLSAWVPTDKPVTLPLGDLGVIGVAGPGDGARALARWMVAQLAALHSPLDVSVLARRGRPLGVHLVLATQRPSGVVSAEIRANTNLRIALAATPVSATPRSSPSRRDVSAVGVRLPRVRPRAPPGSPP